MPGWLAGPPREMDAVTDDQPGPLAQALLAGHCHESGYQPMTLHLLQRLSRSTGHGPSGAARAGEASRGETGAACVPRPGGVGGHVVAVRAASIACPLPGQRMPEWDRLAPNPPPAAETPQTPLLPWNGAAATRIGARSLHPPREMSSDICAAMPIQHDDTITEDRHAGRRIHRGQCVIINSYPPVRRHVWAVGKGEVRPAGSHS